MGVRFFVLLLAGALLLLGARNPAEKNAITLAASRAASVASDRPQRGESGVPIVLQATPVPAGTGGRLSAGPILGLACAFVASTLALGIAFGIRRRIDKIAGPPPDEEDD